MLISMRRIAVVSILLVLVACSDESRLRWRAEGGDPEAMRKYGKHLWRTSPPGDEERVKEALRFLEDAAKKGDTEAMYELGTIWEPSDKALHWFRIGAEKGDPNCMGKIAVAYRYGHFGLQKDEEQYRYWMDKAMVIDRERAKPHKQQ